MNALATSRTEMVKITRDFTRILAFHCSTFIFCVLVFRSTVYMQFMLLWKQHTHT